MLFYRTAAAAPASGAGKGLVDIIHNSLIAKKQAPRTHYGKLQELTIKECPTEPCTVKSNQEINLQMKFTTNDDYDVLVGFLAFDIYGTTWRSFGEKNKMFKASETQVESIKLKLPSDLLHLLRQMIFETRKIFIVDVRPGINSFQTFTASGGNQHFDRQNSN
ncbi:hypothetical protein CLF_108042 [Clonorchis sinensis]|uniref:Uncharacterized protein n=1 Tax=Clonorchis sinensis TaxID=79923 RepID=G7YR88_CLOSI|nr:hypothetical protein CLF_108042 [Clonorchis sinensis]